jgi:hypothetical protein
MIVIADNSPLSTLAEIGQMDALKRSYERIAFPGFLFEGTSLTPAPKTAHPCIEFPPPFLEGFTMAFSYASADGESELRKGD